MEYKYKTIREILEKYEENQLMDALDYMHLEFEEDAEEKEESRLSALLPPLLLILNRQGRKKRRRSTRPEAAAFVASWP